MSTELALSVHFHFSIRLVILVAVAVIENKEQTDVLYEKKDPLCLQNQFNFGWWIISLEN